MTDQPTASRCGSCGEEKHPAALSPSGVCYQCVGRKAGTRNSRIRQRAQTRFKDPKDWVYASQDDIWRLANLSKPPAKGSDGRSFKQDRQQVEANNRRTRAKGLPSNITATQWRGLKALYRFRCAFCNKRPKTLHADHIVPIHLGGASVIQNIQPVCRSCNSKKSATALSSKKTDRLRPKLVPKNNPVPPSG